MTHPEAASAPPAAQSWFKPVEQPRLYVVVAREIATQIRLQRLERGAQLPTERDLAKQYQVSRTTLREAMIALETLGMVEVRVGDGTYVTDPAVRWPARWDGGEGPGPGPHEQFRVRALLECAAAEDAAGLISEEDIGKIRELLRLMEEDLDGAAAEGQRREFHLIIARASGNGLLAQWIDELWRLRSGEIWRKIRSRMARPQDHRDVLEDRKRLFDALCRRDPRGAAQAMGQVMERIRQRYFAALDP